MVLSQFVVPGQIMANTFKFAITKIWEEIPTNIKHLATTSSKNNIQKNFA